MDTYKAENQAAVKIVETMYGEVERMDLDRTVVIELVWRYIADTFKGGGVTTEELHSMIDEVH